MIVVACGWLVTSAAELDSFPAQPCRGHENLYYQPTVSLGALAARRAVPFAVYKCIIGQIQPLHSRRDHRPGASQHLQLQPLCIVRWRHGSSSVLTVSLSGVRA
jgi:hypothetical protein